MLRATPLALAVLLLGVRIAPAADRYELRNSVSPRATASRRLDAADARESVEMSMTLQLRRPEDLGALIMAQQDPQSPHYHRWLTPEEFNARFAPAREDYTAVVDWLERQGFVVRPRISGVRIDFSGTVGSVERTFGVRMNHYSHRGRAHLANENAPLLPSEFANTVAFVRLNTFPLADPLVRISTSSGLATAMAPADMYVAYDMQSLLDAGVKGAGQTIAVVARSDFNSSDVADFQQQFGVPPHDPVKVFPSTNPGIGAPDGVCQGIRNQGRLQRCIQGEEAEVLLDTEWASAMAPDAAVLVDVSGADIDVSLMDIVTNHPEAKTITMSFGLCERLDSSDLTLFGHLYAQAAAQGQAVLVSTGDAGADGCQDGRGRSVNVLASDPNVTAVGGTALDPGFNASGTATAYVGETVWNDNAGASGGGASALVAKPSYQSAPGVPTDGARDQPDIALLASPSQVGYVMILEGQVEVSGGTSGSAPSWAGIVALLNDALRIDGYGPLNTTLYTFARREYAEHGAAVFHDITQGNNSLDGVVGYAAGPGYDLATGLGSPDVALLAQALNAAAATPTPTPTPTAIPSVIATPTAPATWTSTAAPTVPATWTATVTPPALSPTPTALPCFGDCNGDGRVSVDEILVLANVALGMGNAASCASAPAAGMSITQLQAAVNHALNGCPRR